MIQRLLIIVILFTVGIANWNCKNDKISIANEPASQTVREVQKQNGLVGQIELDNGNKWEVNDEMKPYITEGEKLIYNYIQAGDVDFLKLADALKVQQDALVQSCTMTGKSLQELHKWLEPHQKLIEMLKGLPENEMAKKVIKRLQTSYEVYHTNFQ